MRTRATRLVLVGDGHGHVEVLRRLALRPEPDVDVTLIAPTALAAFSRMLPGLVAGHYSTAETHIDLLSLTQRARARFVRDTVTGLDLHTRTLTLAEGDTEPFDLLSLDMGSVPDNAQVPGAREHAIAVRPAAPFLTAWHALRAQAAAGNVGTIAVVGGGATGVELLLAMQHRLQGELRDAAPRLALITDAPHLIPDHPPAVRARLGQLLVARGVVLHQNSGAIAVEPGVVVTTHNRRIAVDRIFWATSAGAQPWPAAAGLACDPHGFVQVDDTLRSTSHPFVFAAGDCAMQVAHPRPKSAALAIRQGPPLATNLRRELRHDPLSTWVPPRSVLSLIGTGGRHAIAARGPLVLEGEWVWRWKDRLDRAFMAKYATLAGTAPTIAASDED